MIVFFIMSFVLLFTLIYNKNSKLSTLLISICFSFFYLYIITEILSVLNRISVKTIAISWMMYDVLLIILNMVKMHKNKIDLKASIQKINIMQIIQSIP